MNNTHFAIHAQLRARLLKYLDEQPHGEVRELIDMLLGLPQVNLQVRNERPANGTAQTDEAPQSVS